MTDLECWIAMLVKRKFTFEVTVVTSRDSFPPPGVGQTQVKVYSVDSDGGRGFSLCFDFSPEGEFLRLGLPG